MRYFFLPSERHLERTGAQSVITIPAAFRVRSVACEAEGTVSLGPPIRGYAVPRPEWMPVPGRPHWFVSTDGKNRWMYAPPLDYLRALSPIAVGNFAGPLEPLPPTTGLLMRSD